MSDRNGKCWIFLSLVLTLSSYAKKLGRAYHTAKPQELNFSPAFTYWTGWLCCILFDDIFNMLEISARLTLHVVLKCLVQGRTLSKECCRGFFVWLVGLGFFLPILFDFGGSCEPKEKKKKSQTLTFSPNSVPLLEDIQTTCSILSCVKVNAGSIRNGNACKLSLGFLLAVMG